MTSPLLGPLSALVTVIAWGTWLAPSQTVPFRNQQVKTFYVAAANLVLALVVTFSQDTHQLTAQTFWPPFLGGLIWSVSGLCAFTATEKLGIARAFGIWAPLNIIVSIFWGAVLFHEFFGLSAVNTLMLFVSLAVIIAGVLMIILPKETHQKETSKVSETFEVFGRHDFVLGVLCAFGAGVLWGSYFIPIKMAQSTVSMWVSTLPLVVGIFAGSSVLVMLTRQPIRLNCAPDYARVGVTGLLWGVGNYAMLVLVDQIGAGKGFTISQLSAVINGLIGVFLLKQPPPRTRAGVLTLVGCGLAMMGGIVLGNLK